MRRSPDQRSLHAERSTSDDEDLWDRRGKGKSRMKEADEMVVSPWPRNFGTLVSQDDSRVRRWGRLDKKDWGLRGRGDRVHKRGGTGFAGAAVLADRENRQAIGWRVADCRLHRAQEPSVVEENILEFAGEWRADLGRTRAGIVQTRRTDAGRRDISRNNGSLGAERAHSGRRAPDVEAN
jgi:hypothetical protein